MIINGTMAVKPGLLDGATKIVLVTILVFRAVH